MPAGQRRAGNTGHLRAAPRSRTPAPPPFLPCPDLWSYRSELQAGVLACKTNKALQEYVVKLRDEGTLARLAAAAVAGAAAAAQAGGGGGGPAAPTTTADEEEWWGDEEEGDEGEEPAAKRARHAKRAPQQAQPPPPAQQPPAQPASSSARTHRFRWITGYQSSTNWACQVHVNPALLTEGYKHMKGAVRFCARLPLWHPSKGRACVALIDSP